MVVTVISMSYTSLVLVDGFAFAIAEASTLSCCRTLALARLAFFDPFDDNVDLFTVISGLAIMVWLFNFLVFGVDSFDFDVGTSAFDVDLFAFVDDPSPLFVDSFALVVDASTWVTELFPFVVHAFSLLVDSFPFVVDFFLGLTGMAQNSFLPVELHILQVGYTILN